MTARQRRLLAMAQSEGDLRYLPELADLSGLAADERGQYTQGVKVEKGIKGALVSNAKQGHRQTGADYIRSQNTRAAARKDQLAEFSKLGHAADAFKAASSREDAQTRTQISTARASAQQEYVGRQQDAVAGYAGRVRALRSEMQSNLANIHNKREQVQAERGLFVATTLDKLLQAAQEQDRAAAKARESARHSRAVEAIALGNLRLSGSRLRETKRSHRANERNAAARTRAAAKRRARARGGKGLLSLSARNSAIDKIERSRAIIRQAKHKGAVGQALVAKGLPRAYVRAGMDLAQFGGLGPVTVHLLHGHGFKIGHTYKILSPRRVHQIRAQRHRRARPRPRPRRGILGIPGIGG